MAEPKIKIANEALDRIIEAVRKIPKKPVGPHLSNSECIDCVFGTEDMTTNTGVAALMTGYAKYEKHLESCLPCIDLVFALYDAREAIGTKLLSEVKLGYEDLSQICKKLEHANCRPIGPHLTSAQRVSYVRRDSTENFVNENYHVSTCMQCCMALCGAYFSTLKMPSTVDEFVQNSKRYKQNR